MDVAEDAVLQPSVDVARLLACPSPEAMQGYYDKLTAAGVGPGLRVQQIGGEMGKGVFAGRDFEVDELVLREPKLVGAQHSANKQADALVCSFCFRYVGSIELQLGHRLCPKEEKGSLGVGEEERSGGDCVDHDGSGTNGAGHLDEETNCGCERSSKKKKALSVGAMAALANGGLRLPHSEHFELPPIVKCKGGCLDNVYCRDSLADISCFAMFWSPLTFQGHRRVYQLQGICRCIRQISRWNCPRASVPVSFSSWGYCDGWMAETNDIFHIAAQVIATTISRARKLKTDMSGKGGNWSLSEDAKTIDTAMLLAAWEPFAMGYKRLWWETVALPEDVDPSDEQAFRSQMKEIATHSLCLLRAALYEEEFSPLFSLQVYGHIIGMFEMNNLEIVVASPVEDYFLYIDDLPPYIQDVQAEAEVVTKPYLDALGDDYAAFCQGSAFFPLQSCLNHSCCPNARAFKRDEDRDGHAVLLATRRIKKGEEVLISYIDEDCPLEERRALLADYAFVCHCSRCIDES